MTISSIIVQTTPKNVQQLVEQFKKSPLCDYHLHDEKGRIIITIEGNNTGEEMQKLTEIQQMQLVESAEMHYSYNETELDQLRENLDDAPIPEWLNDENVSAEQISYNGDLKRKHNYSNNCQVNVNTTE